MKKFLIGVSVLTLMSGCTRLSDIMENDPKEKPVAKAEKDTKEKTVECVNSDQKVTTTFEAKGDKIKKMKQVFFLTNSDLGITDEMNKETIQTKINDTLKEKYQGLEGVTVTGKVIDKEVEVTVEIDYEVADKDALIEAGLLDQGEKQNTSISLQKTQGVFEENGYACEVK
ncbi:MAG: DUF1307 domain-containing protein [Erysipelotrichaceae bacterium]|nr:DUF1307 domain-containing protein [Erysipelotrichaceae bacterium]